MPKLVALDANLILLLVVGIADSKYIDVHKRLRAYTSSDFQMLKSVVASYEELVGLPNSLSETSNIIGFGLTEPSKSYITKVFRENLFLERGRFTLRARPLVDAKSLTD